VGQVVTTGVAPRLHWAPRSGCHVRRTKVNAHRTNGHPCHGHFTDHSRDSLRQPRDSSASKISFNLGIDIGNADPIKTPWFYELPTHSLFGFGITADLAH
jgi:hypothetical protein